MSSRRDRLAAIVQILQVQHAATLAELAERLSVSEMTIRRDLNLLARDEIVKVLHSGAILNPGSVGSSRYSLAEAGAQRRELKMAIGARAATMLAEGDVVIIDGGSTTEYLAKSIPETLRLTVLCWALNILVEVHRRERCSLVFAGGSLHENSLVFESPEGVGMIKRYRANKAFISASGVSEKLGVTCTNAYEIEVKKAAIRSSLDRILLVDSSKYGTIQPAYFADLSEFTAVVTDSGIPPEQAEYIRSLGIALHIT
ncbi:MAG: DeoR/GlpR transcriptional regulator [Spirochaetaceae bacterium]|nr:MAG: DeoR/GlpR transcriptional regulator [Spirochaetaceae bacterium]